MFDGIVGSPDNDEYAPSKLIVAAVPRPITSLTSLADIPEFREGVEPLLVIAGVCVTDVERSIVPSES